MSEEALVRHCAPTLAGIKTANLFTCRYDSEAALNQRLIGLNKLLNPRGVHLICLRLMARKALIYAYRPARLQLDLQPGEAQDFLRACGYCGTQPEGCLRELQAKLEASSDFPHEIGLFLGYPLEDVKAFIENEGRNCKCSGCWKVYTDERKARKLFARYQKCVDVYSRKLSEGFSLQRLAVRSAIN